MKGRMEDLSSSKVTWSVQRGGTVPFPFRDALSLPLKRQDRSEGVRRVRVDLLQVFLALTLTSDRTDPCQGVTVEGFYVPELVG